MKELVVKCGKLEETELLNSLYDDYLETSKQSKNKLQFRTMMKIFKGAGIDFKDEGIKEKTQMAYSIVNPIKEEEYDFKK